MSADATSPNLSLSDWLSQHPLFTVESEMTPLGLRTWYRSPWGFSFSATSHDHWMYHYNHDLEGLPPNPPAHLLQGCCEPSEVTQIVQKMESTPELLEKPDGIQKLEELTGLTAFRKSQEFGRWHLRSTQFSLINNPFQLPRGATCSSQDYEIWFFDEPSPRAHQSFGEVVDGLQKHEFLKPALN